MNRIEAHRIEEIAAAINGAQNISRIACEQIARDVAHIFALVPGFDRAAFFLACGAVELCRGYEAEMRRRYSPIAKAEGKG